MDQLLTYYYLIILLIINMERNNGINLRLTKSHKTSRVIYFQERYGYVRQQGQLSSLLIFKIISKYLLKKISKVGRSHYSVRMGWL